MSTSLLEGLRAKFPPEKVEQRPGGGGVQLDYVPIETVLERLLDVAPQYTLTPFDINLQMTPSGHYQAHAVIELTIDSKCSTGVGAMLNRDPDMAIKSALSEAIKNAAKNGWGVMLYLWHDDERAVLADQREALAGDPKALRRELIRLATEDGVDTSNKTAIAEHYGVDVTKPDAIAALLRERGRL